MGAQYEKRRVCVLKMCEFSTHFNWLDSNHLPAHTHLLYHMIPTYLWYPPITMTSWDTVNTESTERECCAKSTPLGFTNHTPALKQLFTPLKCFMFRCGTHSPPLLWGQKVQDIPWTVVKVDLKFYCKLLRTPYLCAWQQQQLIINQQPAAHGRHPIVQSGHSVLGVSTSYPCLETADE